MKSMSSPHPHSGLHDAIEHTAHHLPAQAPLEVFVHHNTLHAFQHLDFHDALEEARARFGAEGYLPEERYREEHARGRIRDSELDSAIARWLLPGLGSAPAGLPRAAELARLVLVHGIAPESPAGLQFRLHERDAAERFDAGVHAVAKNRIVRETTAWLRQRVRAGGASFLPLLAGHEGGPEEQARRLEEILGASPTPERLLRALDQEPERLAVAALWEACRTLASAAAPVRSAPAAAPSGSLRELIQRVSSEDPDDLVHPALINLAGAFLDRGQSRWSMPDRDAGFFVAFCRVLGAGHAVRPAWLSSLGGRVRRWTDEGKTAEDVIEEAMSEIGVAEADRAAFIESTLLDLPGWAGMFHRLESAPGPVGRSHARVRLVDFLAVRLILDVLALADVGRRLGHRGPLRGLRAHLARKEPLRPAAEPGEHDRAWPLFLLAQHAGMAAPELRSLPAPDARALLELVAGMDRRARLRAWQEAFEQHYRDQVLRALSEARRSPAITAPARFQIVCCIDDRTESLRRHFEEMSPDHETHGAAGFFNLAIAYQGIDDPTTFPLCPVVVSPRHVIQEEPVSEHAERAEARRRWKRRMGSLAARFDSASRSVIWGPLIVALAGLLAALPLLAAVFAPWWAGKLRRKVGAWLLPPPRTRLTLPPSPDEATGEELATGFSIEEKAERVGDLLENMGLVRGFARIVALLGHDSASVNNPHFAAYSCGACGGRSGGPNARLFARMANRPEVRERLRPRGIDIPKETVFVGGVQNTCTESIDLFDTDLLPIDVLPELEALESALAEAAMRNAHERCRRLASAPKSGSQEAHLRHVEQRAFDLGQARPELGHATNAACFVGRRALSRGLFLDRRAFLVSYDPGIDAEGRVLERLLSAVVPVGAGINLEYFFSTVDNERLGAGTKLPHNVVGLFGVMNGPSSDLRTGLPRQMIEIHEPVRLQVVIEARSETILAILDRQPGIRELVTGAWVRVCSLDPATGEVAVFDPRDGFVPWKGAEAHLHRVAQSSDWYSGKEGFLPPALVLGAQEMLDVA